ncbi:MAG TPA: TatD family hydrolase [Candidatus Saccharimonadales bacterium]|nr:TatD family hydrolase [Candidatus Saccharimonadales bacterium]
MELVDSHCHLQFEKLASDLDGVLSRAGAAGVNRMICVGTDLEDSRQSAEIAAKFDNVWAAVGVHPHEATKFLKDPQSPKILNKLSILPKVVAIGEVGLDYYKSQTPPDVQQEALRAQVEAGLPTGLPFIFHVRDAWTDFWRIFDEHEGLRGVIHSFSSGRKQLDAALNRGLYIGLNGIMTFTRDEAQLESARRVPLERLLIETDAPFLGPAPERPSICEPRHVAVTAEFLAELRGESLEDLAKTSTTNAIKLFGLK